MPIHFDGHSKVHARAHPEATTNAQHKRAAVLTLSRHQEKRAAVGKNRKRGTGGLSASAGSDPLPFPVAHATSTSKMRDQRNDENTGKELCILHLVPFGSISITRAIKKKREKHNGEQRKRQLIKCGKEERENREEEKGGRHCTHARRHTDKPPLQQPPQSLKNCISLRTLCALCDSGSLYLSTTLCCDVRLVPSLPRGGVLQNSARPSRKEKSKRKIPHGCIESQGRESKEKRFETHAQVKESMSHIRTRISYTKGKATRATAVQRACVYVGHLVCLQIAKEKVKKETSRCQ